MDNSTPKTNQLKEKIMIAVKSYLSIQNPNGIGTCGKYSPDDFDDYIENALPDDEERELATHCLECVLCLNELRRAFERDEEAKKKTAVSTNSLFDKAIELMDDSDFTEDTEYMDGSDYYAESMLAFAAAPNDKSGESLGVAVTKDGLYGVLIKCSAWVGDIQQDGSIDIIGKQVIKTADGLQTNEPLEFLTKKLKNIFQTCPALTDYKLDRRIIHVEIKEKIIAEVESLTLSVIIAILNAIHSVKQEPPAVFSAAVDFSGELDKVGRIAEKIKTVAKVLPGGILIISEKNKDDCPEEHGLKIYVFKNLDDLLNVINYPPLNAPKESNTAKDCNEESSTEKPIEESEEKSSNPFVKKLSIVLVIVVLLALALNLLSSNKETENKSGDVPIKKEKVQSNEEGTTNSAPVKPADNTIDAGPEIIVDEEKPKEPELVKINTYFDLGSAESFVNFVQSKTDLKLTIIKKNMDYHVMVVVDENTSVEEIYSKVESVTGIKIEKDK